MDDVRKRTIDAWKGLYETMGKVLGLPPGFGVRLTAELEEALKSDDPETLEKFIKWANKAKADLK